jgi:hypothetical protein
MLDIWRGERDKTAKDKKDRRSAGKGDSEDIDMLSRVKRYVCCILLLCNNR